MQQGLAEHGKRLARLGAIVQTVVIMVLLLATLIINKNHLIGVLLGGLAYLVPYLILAYWFFRHAGATKSKLIVQSFSQGIKFKMLVTVLFFTAAFSFIKASFFSVIGAYVVVMVSHNLTMLICRKNA